MKRLILTSLCLLFARGAFAWGQKGHDVTAYIAECRLTPEAAEKVRKALDGYSPVYIANWLDFASYWPEYAYSKTWHYLNIDEGETLESMSRNPGGDVLTAVTRLTEKLKSGRLTPEEETLSLKMLIHLVGDMHCPMHLGRLSDLGGNKRPVRFFGRDTNLHSVWEHSRGGPQMELQRVAAADRPADGRRGCADRRRRAGRLGEGDARNLQGDLRLHPRRDRYFVRLPLQVHARRRTAVPARRTPPGPPAERDIPINASAQDKAARRRETGGRFVSGAPNQ